MDSVEQVLVELRKLGNEQTRKTYARHGIEGNVFGVKIADLKLVAKKIKGNQSLAYALYESGNYDAMYLAGIVANGSMMSKKQLESWTKSATWDAISAYTVPSVAAESPHARELAMKWIKSKSEAIATSGWNTYSLIVATTADDQLDLAELSQLLNSIVGQIIQAPNRVRYAMNGFVISIGTYVTPLLKQAKATAQKIGEVSVDMGDTACKVPIASAYIEKVESMGRVGKKRKSTKC